MPRSARRSAAVVLAVVVLLAGGLGLGLSHVLPGTPSPAAASGPSPARSAPARASPDRPASASPPAPLTAGRPLLLPPNPRGLSVAPAASSAFAATPAPMGVSDLGVNGSGAYEYGTASFEGVLTLDSYGAFTASNTTNVSFPAPDWSVLQLDAVAVNVTVPPADSNGTFWVQNGLHLNGTTAELQDNIWNFTSKNPSLPSNALEGKIGSILYGEVYSAIGPTLTITYPLTIELFDNISTVGQKTVVSFGYSIGARGGTYDTVTFNGTAASGAPSQFLVDGEQLIPSNHLLYDTEFVLGGNGDGSNVDLTGVTGTMTLDRKVGSSYEPVPAAYDFGVDTSETALGLAVAWSGTTAQLSAGPSFLVGLWGTAGPEQSSIAPPARSGSITVRIDLTPSYAILFATTAALSLGPLVAADYSYAPTDPAGDLVAQLPPNATDDPYNFTAWADGYGNASVNVSTSLASPALLSLPAAPPSSPLDAPVYLLGAAQVTAFTASVDRNAIPNATFSSAQSILRLNASKVALAAPFLRVNDFEYPTFTLLAAWRCNISIVVDRFVQSPSSYVYTNENGTSASIVNWTQGYFFYYGTGAFTVENTTIEGSTALVYRPYPVYPPSTIEFYGVHEAVAANITASSDAIGVSAIDSASTRLINLAATTGALAVEAIGPGAVSLSYASASGADPEGSNSALADFLSTSSVTASHLSVSDTAYGIAANDAGRFDLTNLTVSSNAWGLLVNASSPGILTNLSVTGLLSVAGIWSNSSGLTLSQFYVNNGTGLNLSNDSSVSFVDGNVTGVASDLVTSFYNSSSGTFRDVSASDGAEGLDLEGGTNVNASDVEAVNGSIGVDFSDDRGASGTDFTSENLSLGVFVNGTSGGGALTDFVVSDESVGAAVADSAGLSVSSVSASNLTLGSSTFLLSTTIVPIFALAGVVLLNDSSVTVTNVSVDLYPYAVWSNNSSSLTVSEIVSTYGFEAVLLNYTNASRVTEVFAFADVIGVDEENCTGTTVATSTIEDTGGVGLELANGSRDTVESNNFIGDNGSSVSGGFDASHLQAYANNTTGAAFKTNYWADRAGSSYVIFPGNATAPAIKDASPLSGFSSTYLEFHEKGLPSGWSWSILLRPGITWTTNVSVLYLPGWILSDGAIAFTVGSEPGYPPHPPSGSLVWDAASVSQGIVFGSPGPAPLSPLVWYLAAGAGAAAVVVGILLLRKSRARRRTKAPKDWSPNELP
jgi:hypothetical protein